MHKVKAWISAARPRTLPLSISGILIGTGLAIRESLFDPAIFILALLTTLGFQILSNFANDYGDGVKGTDNNERLGPVRAIQSGAITDKEMKKAMIWTSSLTFLCVILLLLLSFNGEQVGYAFLFLFLGIMAIVAAIKYTVGKTAYGYRGLGDIFVFVFFGLLSAVGSYFLYSKALTPIVWVLATIIGLLSTAVLNLNNIRDIRSDKKAGKITLAVILGEKKAKIYHSGLLVLSFLLTLLYTLSLIHI